MVKKYWSAIATAAVLIVAFVMHLLVEYDKVDFGSGYNYWFFIFAAFGLAIILLIRAFQTANRFNYVLIATGLVTLAGVVLAASLTKATVHTILLGVAVFCAVMFILAMFISSRNKKDIGKNEQEGYKTYAERKAEEEALPEEEPVLPTVKSFEDVNKED